VRYFPWLLFFIRSHCLNRRFNTGSAYKISDKDALCYFS
jgi:hypothetical protein